MKRYCQTQTIKDDKLSVEQYLEVHRHVWPEVIEGQHQVGILQMQIFAAGNVLFMIVDTVDEFDWDRDMDRLAALPRQAEWEAYVSRFQGCSPEARSTEKWHLIGKIFDSEETVPRKKVFVSGCYDLLHSGHVEFFRQAARYGDLYVGIGSDATIAELKHHKTMFPESERLFMVKSVRYVKDAFINQGSGMLDFLPTLDIVKPDVLVVNSDGGSKLKRELCEQRGIEYVVLERQPHEGLEARSSTSIKSSISSSGNSSAEQKCCLPTRLDLAGTWIDQPSVSCLHPGWAITLSLEPTFEIRERCGLSTSTRNVIKKIWPYKLPNMDPETLARLVFCFENHPERDAGHVSGAQDSLGICMAGLCRHYYDNHFWPERVETCSDPAVLDWLEQHIAVVELEPRKAGCSVVEGNDVTLPKVKALADAADRCWDAVLAKDLTRFAEAFADSFNAQIAMFPGMVTPTIEPVDGESAVDMSVKPLLEHYLSQDNVLAIKFFGAGGGGNIALVVDDADAFLLQHPEALRIKVRR